MRICVDCLKIVEERASHEADSDPEPPVLVRNFESHQLEFAIPSESRPKQPPLMGIQATRTPAANRTQVVVEAFPNGSRSSSSHNIGIRGRRSRDALDSGISFSPDNESKTDFGDASIDPELAPYISDEESAGDYHSGSIFATLAPRPSNAVQNAGHPTRSRSSTKSGSDNTGYRNRRPSFASESRRRKRSRSRSVAFKQLRNLQDQSILQVPTRLGRSVSIQQESDHVELNAASMHHVKRLFRQMLNDANIGNCGRWEEVILPLLLRASDDLKIDVRHGDDFDIRHYVKIKNIMGGKPENCQYISGVVFSKNLALKSMSRAIANPRIVILDFPIEYQRGQRQFLSLEAVIAQEKEYIRNLSRRVIALRPNIVVVGKSVSGIALQHLADANIAVVYGVKASVIQAISRCAQADILKSVDKLSLSPRVGRCADFHVQTIMHSAFPGQKKTFMFFAGCPAEMGCTVVLRGSSCDTLKRIKQIVEEMIFVVYNLKLETSLMRDEFALIPSDNVESDGGVEERLVHEGQSTYYSDMISQLKTRILSSSPFVKFPAPQLLLRSRHLETQLTMYEKMTKTFHPDDKIANEKDLKFEMANPAHLRGQVDASNKLVREVARAILAREYQMTLEVYETGKKNWESFLADDSNLFDPASHQNVVVLFSMVCTQSTIPCHVPELFVIEYYRETDFALGQYVEDLCANCYNLCNASECDKKINEHHYSYVHGSARISTTVEDFPCPLPGMQNTILMWSFCKLCKKTTPVIPMSETSWRYSFGKYLELAFWSTEISCRASFCPHNIHRDHVRYFGLQDCAVRFQYDPIDVLQISVPRMKITWAPETILRRKNDDFFIIERRGKRFFDSVKTRLQSVQASLSTSEKAHELKLSTMELMVRADEEKADFIHHLRQIYTDSRFSEILPLNRALRALQGRVVLWETSFSDMEKNVLLSEKDIRRLTAMQLKKFFMDRDNTSDVHGQEMVEMTPSMIQASSEQSDLPSVEAEDHPEAKSSNQGFPKTSLTSTRASQSGKAGDPVAEDPRMQTSDPKAVNKTSKKHLWANGKEHDTREKQKNTSPLDEEDIEFPKDYQLTSSSQNLADSEAEASKDPVERQKSKEEDTAKNGVMANMSRLASRFDSITREHARSRQSQHEQALSRRRSTVKPVSSSRPVVEIYSNLQDAVSEHSDDGENDGPTSGLNDSWIRNHEDDKTPPPVGHDLAHSSQQGHTGELQDDRKSLSVTQDDLAGFSLPKEAENISVDDFVQHGPERMSLIKSLSNFWADRSSTGWAPLEYPL